MSRDIAIIGMECVLPGAANLAEYWDNLVEGVDAIRAIPPGRLNGRDRLSPVQAQQIPCGRGGFLPEHLRFDPLKFGVMPSIVPHGDPDQFLMLHVIAGALSDAGVAADHPARQRTDVIIGRGGYITNKMSEIYYRTDLLGHLLDYLARRFPELGKDDLQRVAEELQATVPRHDVDSISTCIPNLVASRTANRLDLRGAAYTVDAACASSLLAVEHGTQRLRQGLCDLAVASGIFLCQTPTFWSIFAHLGAMSPSQQIRPFDRRADGLLVGEGAGAVILKRLDDAQRDGDRVYAVIKGVGAAGDGRDTHILSSSSRGQVQALKVAYEDGQIDPATIGYLEAHGTATVAGDLAELQTIKAFYGARGKFPPARAMGSVKSMIGHTMPAAGIASIIKVALCLSNKCLVPSLHCDEPHAALLDAAFYVNRETRPWIHAAGGAPRRGGVNAFGFGGINAHVILEEVPAGAAEGVRPVRTRPHRAGGQRDSELLLLSAPSAEELVERLDRVESYLARQNNVPALEDLAFALLSEVDFAHGHKLALVIRDLAQARQLIAACLRQLREDGSVPEDAEGAYHSTAAAGPIGKIAGIFPGIGFPGLIGNYPVHLMELCRHFPEVRDEFDKVEQRDRHPDDPIPTSLVFLPPSILPDELQLQLRGRVAAMKVIEGADGREIAIEPSQRNIAASGVTLSNWVSWLVLKNLQVPVDMVCGQSQGEIAAICATNMLDVETVIPRFWQALAVSPSYAGRGRLAFVAAGEERVAPYLAESPDTSIAIHIAPEMLVIGGMDDHIASVAQRLRDAGIIAKELPYPPIHTPRLSHMRDELKQIIDMDFRFRKPSFPIYSAITEAPFPDGEDEIRELALDNLDRPVRFWQTIHRMYADGARIFLQIGGGSLAANIKSVLPKPDILGTAVDVDHYHPITQLNHLCAELFTAGVRFDPSYLFRHRSPRRLDLDAAAPPPDARHGGLPLRMDWVPLPNAAAAEEARPLTTDHRPLTTRVADATVADDTPAPAAEPALGEREGLESAMPLVGDVVQLVPRKEIVTERMLDLDEDLFLRDHVLIDEGSGKPVEHRLPILPMTMILEAAAETAACLAPGLGLIGFERITAHRWIDFRDSRTLQLTVTARLDAVDPETGVHRISAEVASNGRPSASATVLFADAYREDVQLRFTEFQNPRSWPLTAEEIYTERYMFHGPRFRCVTGLNVLGDQGLWGEITVQPKHELFASAPDPQLLVDPVVLDGVAQLVAMFAIVNGVFLMPAKITKLEFYGPTPPPGTRVPVRIEVRNMSTTQRTVTADAEVQDGNGGVWFRFEGINEWLYDYPPQLQDTQRLPGRFHLATETPLPAVEPGTICTLLRRADLRHANIEWLARLFLDQTEWTYFDALKLLPRQWQWLMGRIAVKDAVRLHLARQMGTEMIHPALISIAADEAGKPYVVPLEGCPPMPEISIAHTEGWAAALAADAGCGIDIEPVARDVAAILPRFTTAEEIGLIRSIEVVQGEASWPLRLWCAKEAVGKALGTGLDGRPTDFQAVDIEPDGRVLVYHRPGGNTYAVHTAQNDFLLLAYATLTEAGVEVPVEEEADSTSDFVSLHAPR